MTKIPTLGRLAGLCYRRRHLVALAWLAVAAGLLVLGVTRGAPSSNDFSGGDSDSARAASLLSAHFPDQRGASLTLAVHAGQGVRDPAVQARVAEVLGALRRSPHVVRVTDPYQAPGHICADGGTAFAEAALSVSDESMPATETLDLVHQVRAASHDSVTFALGGSAVDIAETPGGGPSDGIGMTAALVVLLVAFGSVLAAVLPLVTAIFGIGVGLAGMMLLNHVLPSPGFTPILGAMIGLGVGVDYALFIVTRYREALAAGADPQAATVQAMATAGRAVLFAGGTVVVGLLGLLLMRQPLLRGVAVDTALTVALTMLAAVTLLPALLGFTRRGIDRLRVPHLGRRSGNPLAARWAGVIARRPVLATVGAAVVLLALAAPALGMRLSMPDASTQPHDTSGYASHRILAAGFGEGYDAPLVLVGPPAAVREAAGAVAATPGIASVSPARISSDGAAALVVAYPTTSGQAAPTAALVRHLRAGVLPAGVHLGGPVAGTVDFADQVGRRLPVLIVVVVGLSLLLLIAIFRSVTLAVKAAVVNLISIGAAYGVLVAAVQWGWLTRVLGFPGPMPVAAYVPMIMFPVLFGLSMDYEVFLVSRIREAYDRTGHTRSAVVHGLSRTARVITAAAAIMIVVFLSVMFGADLAVKQLGLGLAVMVFVDATLVRMVLVPAAMELFGRANWYLPRWLDRLLPAVPTEPEEPQRVLIPA
jgi:putative drug exporter of the RND superfamily